MRSERFLRDVRSVSGSRELNELLGSLRLKLGGVAIESYPDKLCGIILVRWFAKHFCEDIKVPYKFTTCYSSMISE